jgi:hypothetical protein
MGLITRRVLGRIIGNTPSTFAGMDNPIWWNSQFARATIGQHGRPASGGSPKPEFRVKVVPRYSSGFTLEVDRDWTAPHQDITVHFDAMMEDPALIVGGPATGHTIKVNTIPQTTIYLSGSGENKWRFRIPILVHQDDVITWSYDPLIGDTVTVFEPPVELDAEVDREVENYLEKYIRFTLLDGSCLPIANETVKFAIDAYDGGIAANSNWMLRRQFGTVTTDGTGLVFFIYNGVESAGDIVYVTVIRPDILPTESMVWTTIIQ